MDCADEFAVGFYKGFDSGLFGRLADEIRNVDGVEVAGREEAIYGAEIDVVGVAEIWLRPSERLNRGVGGWRVRRRFGSDDGVLAIGFVPDGSDFDSVFGGEDAGFELGFGLMREAVAYSEGEFAECDHGSFNYVVRRSTLFGTRY